jgi:hypothetical protein
MSKKQGDQVISDRRIAAALRSKDVAEEIRVLTEEAFRRGFSAGQMKERLR